MMVVGEEDEMVVNERDDEIVDHEMIDEIYQFYHQIINKNQVRYITMDGDYQLRMD